MPEQRLSRIDRIMREFLKVSTNSSSAVEDGLKLSYLEFQHVCQDTVAIDQRSKNETMDESLYVCTLYVRMYVCMGVRVNVCICVWVYVFMGVCVWVYGCRM